MHLRWRIFERARNVKKNYEFWVESRRRGRKKESSPDKKEKQKFALKSKGVSEKKKGKKFINFSINLHFLSSFFVLLYTPGVSECEKCENISGFLERQRGNFPFAKEILSFYHNFSSVCPAARAAIKMNYDWIWFHRGKHLVHFCSLVSERRRTHFFHLDHCRRCVLGFLGHRFYTSFWDTFLKGTEINSCK